MASLSCGYKCLQIFLVVFNVLVCTCGIVAVVIGSLSQVAINKYSTGVDSNIKCLVIFVIALGCFLVVFGFLGFFGLVTKNTFCLILFHCCGSESPKDYISTKQTIPDSCKNPETKITYSDGCLCK
ncbi:unnamed protein product [Schistosoma bovis]|nr:unnamed protein product [Schistosoma bovis]